MNIMPLVVGWRDVGNEATAAALYANLSTQLIEGASKCVLLSAAPALKEVR